MGKEKGNSSELAAIRSIAIVSFLLESLGCGLYVLFQRTKYHNFLSASSWKQQLLTLANAFSGGLFLALGLIHILPEAAEAAGEAFGEDTEDRYRLAFAVAGGAYLLLLFLQRYVAAPKDTVEDNLCYTADDSTGLVRATRTSTRVEPEHQLCADAAASHNHDVNYGSVDGPEHIRHSTRASDALVRAVIGRDDHHGHQTHDTDEENGEAGRNRLDTEMLSNDEVASNGVAPSSAHSRPKQNASGAGGAFSHEGLKAVVLLVALSIHSIAAGMALGLESSTHGALTLLFALLMHKWAAAVALGTSFAAAVPVAVSRTGAAITISCFSCTTPLGVVIGWIASDTLPDEVNSILTAFTAGTFLYLSAEIGTDEFVSGGHYGRKYVAYIAAFVLVYAVTAWAG